jgi:RNA polymerase sigma-70 factor (ECF subfamily)
MVKDGHPITDDKAIQRIVARAQAGEQAAFGEIYERYAANVRTMVRRIVADAHEVEDVTQQVFTKLFSCIGAYEPRTQPFHHWLGRVARNQAIDSLRRRRPTPVDEIYEGAADSGAAGSEVVDCLRTALADLTAEQRQIVLMRHLVGLSPDEIAQRTGRTTAAVHGLHFRARRQLQCRLAALGMRPQTLARAA